MTKLTLPKIPLGPRPPSPSGASLGRTRALVAILALVASALVLAGGASPAAAAVVTRAYVANRYSDDVSVIDTATNTVVATIPVGDEPMDVALTTDGTRAYVTNARSNTVSVIDTATNTVVATIPVDGGPVGVAVTPDGTRAYVTNAGAGTVSVIDTATNTVMATIPFRGVTFGVAVTPDGSRVYVPNREFNTVSVIDTATNTVMATIPVGRPQEVAITPDGTRAYVTNPDSNTVSVIDTATNTVMATIPVEGGHGVAITPDGTRAYVTNTGSGTVSVIDTATNTVVATIPVGVFPYRVAASPDGTGAYVTNLISDTVSVIDTATNTVVDTITAGDAPYGVAVAALPDLPLISVDKTAESLSRPEPGGDFTYTVVVTNPSTFEAVTITSLTDDVYGDLNGRGTCAVGTVLAVTPGPGNTYTCSFTAPFTGSAGASLTDVVTVVGVDDDGQSATDTDDATVTLTAAPPTTTTSSTTTTVAPTTTTSSTTTTVAPTTTTSSTTTTVAPTTTTTTPPPSSTAPTNLTITDRTASTVSLSWDPVADATEYRAYVSRTSGSGYFLWASGFTGTSATLYSLTGDFYVVMRAVIDGVESPNSNEVLASAEGTTTTPPPASTAPTAPTDLTITDRTASTVGLSWEPVAGATEYRAYVSRTSGSGYFLWASGFTGTSATLYSLTGDFYVVMRAVIDGVESPNSNEVLASAP